MKRLIFALLLAGLSPVEAKEVSCADVRSYVAIHGLEAARAEARRRGYTEEEIAEVERRCLK